MRERKRDSLKIIFIEKDRITWSNFFCSFSPNVRYSLIYYAYTISFCIYLLVSISYYFFLIPTLVPSFSTFSFSLLPNETPKCTCWCILSYYFYLFFLFFHVAILFSCPTGSIPRLSFSNSLIPIHLEK